MTSPPRAQRRVIITRAADQIEPLAVRLREVGVEPVALSLIEIVEASDGGAALHDALGRLEQFDWLVVTSPNGASRVAAAIQKNNEKRPRLAAVGTATAAALTVAVDLVPRRQIAEGLIDQFPDGTGSILIVQAEQARPTLARGLAKKGWHVEVVAAYRSLPIKPESIDESEVASADAVLFTSGSAIRAWVDALVAVKSPPLIVIGPATAEVAQALGLKVAAVAADHSLDGLVKCLMAYFRERG